MVSEHSSADVAVPVELDCVSTLSGHTDVVWCVAWHPGQDLVLASCGSDKTIRIWKQVGRDHQKQWVCFATVATGHKRTIRCLAWSPDGSMLASGGFDGIVNIWSLVESTDDGSDDESQPTYSIVATLEGHENEVKSLSWSSCAHPFLLATCSRDKSVWIWELTEDGDFECISVLQGHSQDVKCVRWHPTQRMLLSSSYDDTIKIWAEDEDEWFCTQTLRGHTSTVWSIDFLDTEGKRFISCSDDQTLIIWRNSQSDQLASQAQWDKMQVLSGYHDRPIFSIAVCLSYTSPLFVSAGGDDQLCVFHTELIKNADQDDECDINASLHCRVPDAHEGEVNCVAWSNGASPLLASCGDDYVVKIWRFRS